MPPRPLLFGGETEYALGAIRAGGAGYDQRRLVADVMAYARRVLPYTSTSTNGRFLSNGGLLYNDCGFHVEWSTPEVTTPADVVRYLRAGDQLIETLMSAFQRDHHDVSATFASRCSVDYAESTVWASHESYLHRTACPLEPELIPFLASRVILCGGGGWDLDSPGLRFTLSPRAGLITHLTHRDSQIVRPLFHYKEEALSTTGTDRLHVACSESLNSDAGTWLRFGITALVLACIDAGDRPGASVALASPLLALKRFAADVNGRARVRLASRATASAFDIQRRYLAMVESRAGAGELPDWAAGVCREWRAALDALEDGPGRCRTRLDWCIKREVFAAFLARHGFDWNELPVLNRQLERALCKQPSGASLPPRLADLRRLREPLFEIDMRFGELGEQGIFGQLDRSGVLEHAVAGVDAHSITEAATEPPEGTRAAVRGRVVSRLTEAREEYSAEWVGVHDHKRGQWLDLGDPFMLEERWISGAAFVPRRAQA